jgi:RNA-directed DNA polymerase
MYTTVSIPKKSGGTRIISMPDKRTREALPYVHSRILGYVNGVYGRNVIGPTAKDILGSDYASKGKGCKANARVHYGAFAVLNCDIADFFGSITPGRFFAIYPMSAPAQADVRKYAFHHGVLPTGAMTSPLMAGIYMFFADKAMRTFCVDAGKRHGVTLHYTRYVDDITVSVMEDVGRGRARTILLEALRHIHKELALPGMRLNNAKTRIQCRGEHQSVTGITIAALGVGRQYIKRVKLMIKHVGPATPISDLQRIAGMIGYVTHHNPRTGKRLRDKFKARTQK